MYLKILKFYQNNILRIILHQNSLEDSTKMNCMHLGILLVWYLYEKKNVLLFMEKIS